MYISPNFSETDCELLKKLKEYFNADRIVVSLDNVKSTAMGRSPESYNLKIDLLSCKAFSPYVPTVVDVDKPSAAMPNASAGDAPCDELPF